MLTSQMCRKDVLVSEPFLRWADAMRPAWDRAGSGAPVLMHRKMWEWLFITQALAERDMLRPGTTGLGFGVGQEPLVALFASLGCTIVATDMPADQAQAVGWASDGQFAADLQSLNKDGLCDPGVFERSVTYRTVDMNAIPRDLRHFDFSWSSCAFEHLGTIDKGLRFVRRQMRCIVPGGVSVHTTEFNVASDTGTVDDYVTVLYRRRDLERLARILRRAGHRITLDFRPGDSLEDEHVDLPPYSDVHLRTAVQDFVTTSYGLVIEKRGRRRPDPRRHDPDAPRC